jgi:hypothetical protein
MTLIQGGPPEWVWERPPSLLQWEVAPSKASNGQPVYELRLNCHLEIMRLHFFTEHELQDLRAQIAEVLSNRAREGKPGNSPTIPEAEQVLPREEGTVSNPDFSIDR